MRLAVLFAACALGLAAPAGAEPRDPRGGVPGPPDLARGVDYVIVEPGPDDRTPRGAAGPDLLVLNRCPAGCTVTRGVDDARAKSSSIPPGTRTLSAFQYTDQIWDAVVACVRDTFAPYGVDVVTEAPPTGDFVEVMVAGSPSELGLPANTLGIAPMDRDCRARVNWIAFAFANVHGTSPVLDLCATVAHEAGHVYGLDHEYDCKDAMTYLNGCGQKWFLNVAAPCGEFDGPRACRCGATQNSHVKLLGDLGPGTPPPPPAVEIPYPSDGASVGAQFAVFGRVDEARVVDRVELWLNGWPWLTLPGRRDAAPYSFTAPAELPDGIIDVEVRAYNDVLGVGVATITVTKGAPCTSAATCLDGQACDDGRCAWPPPTGQFGDACERDADCVSRVCGQRGGEAICVEACVVGDPAGCPDGFTCTSHGDRAICWPPGDGGGCCSAGGGGLASGALAAALLGLLGRRRRRR